MYPLETLLFTKHMNNPTQEHTPTTLAAKTQQSGDAISIIPLDLYRTVSISGPDAHTFLQGQLTCDVNALSGQHSQFGAHCNVKGRIISNFLISRHQEDVFILRWHQSINDIAGAALKKYMVFSKATLRDEPEWSSIGLLGEDADALLNTLIAGKAIDAFHRISAIQIECLVSPKSTPAFLTLTAELPQSDVNTWRHALITNGIVDVDAAISETFLPQELNLEQRGGISFKKGCYTGQEVIARLHYKGKLKKTLQLGSIKTIDGISHDLTIASADTHKALGNIISSETNPGQKSTEFLALVNTSVENTSPMLMGNVPMAIEWLDIPSPPP